MTSVNGKHSFESVLLALLSANIPADRLVGTLFLIGLEFDEAKTVRRGPFGSGHSLAGTKALIRERVALCREMYPVLCQAYEGIDVIRMSDGTVSTPRAEVRVTDSDGVAIQKIAQAYSSQEDFNFCETILQLHKLEQAFIEAVRKGDKNLFFGSIALS
jgi:hypothetical protein